MLADQRATSELAAYNRINSVVSVNKGVTFGLAPLVGIGLSGHIWKTKPTDISKHKKVGVGVFTLMVLTNVASAYYSS